MNNMFKMDFSIKRIFRFYLAVCLFIFIAYQVIPVQPIPQGVEFHNPSVLDIINGFIGVVRAESGSIIISDDKSQTYTLSPSGTSGATLYWNTIKVDSSDYNYLSSFHVIVSGASFSKDFASTPFTFSSCAVGSGGFASYDKNTTKVYYVFSSDMRITCSPIIINPSVNIFVDISSLTGSIYSGVLIDSSHPVGIREQVTSNDWEVPGIYESVNTATRATDHYDVTYPFPGWFTVNITKNSSVNTKYFINSYGGTIHYSQESSFNHVNITNASFPYGNGISLNATLASGLYTIAFVNSTNAEIPVVTPTPTPLPIPLSGASLQFTSSSYEVGSSPTIQWAVSNSEWGCFLCSAWYLSVVDDKGTDITGTYAIGSQTGSRSFLSTTIGTWTATLKNGIFFPTETFTATTQVIPSSAYTEDNITTNKAVYSSTDLITISGYKILPLPGWVAISPSLYPDAYLATFDTTLNNVGGIAGGNIHGNFSHSIHLPTGNYQAQLNIGGSSTGVTTIKRVFFSVNDTGNYSIYWVSADIYGNHFLPSVFGELFDIRYTSKNPSDIISVTTPKGNNYETWTVAQASGENQIFITGSDDNLGTWTATITNSSNSSNFSAATITLIQPGTVSGTSGNNSIMTWTPNKVNINDRVILSWFTTNISNYNIKVYGTNSNTVFSNKSYISTVSGSLEFVFTISGNYYAEMTNNTDGSLIKSVLLVVSSPSGTTGTTPGQPPTNNQNGGEKGINNLLSFIGQTAFWGFLMWIVIVHISRYNPFISFVGFVVELVLGLFDPYTLWLFAILVIGIVIIGIIKVFTSGDGKSSSKGG